MKHLKDGVIPLEKDKMDLLDDATLVDKVEKSIIDYIKNNALKVGDALPKELEIAESLGVSRTAVREAMLRLRTLGLIESRKHRGIVFQKHFAEMRRQCITQLLLYNFNFLFCSGFFYRKIGRAHV